MSKKKIKALVLLSGGLDSILAVKLLQRQGIEVIAINFSSPFFSEKNAVEAAKQLKVKLITIDLSREKNFHQYLNVIHNPKHGYGSVINPCIDCRIFMLKKAKALMPKFKTKFIVTGEVLNERPMSQTRNNLMLIEKEAGLENKILRPLSAKLLPKTEAERLGVDRNKLLDIQGRSRKRQIELAAKYKLSYQKPAGGCLLCEQEFAKKLRDLFKYKKKIELRDIELLKLGRHFRVGKAKIIVGRNEKENKIIQSLANNNLIFQVKDFPSPISLLEGKPNEAVIKTVAALTLSHSDARDKKQVQVAWGKGKLNKFLRVSPLSQDKIDKMRLK